MNIYLIGMIISFSIYIVLGFIISRKVKDANDFYVAGRKAPVLLIVGSMIASYVSTGMFMGDAGIEKEKDILDKYNINDIDVLKVGHHGSKRSSGKEFIDEINPKYSIISIGKNNRYGHPNKEVLNNLKDSKLYRTDIDGSIMFKIKNNKLKIETCSP
jgi:beta-lactamase superfamily II metal-dependent hydrolase